VPADRVQHLGARLAILGAALVLCDGVLTPAISVLSAVEGLEVAAPALAPAVLPITVGILLALFRIQRGGTARIDLTLIRQSGPETWQGWVQERGLYFPNKWDAAYEAILSMNDSGEQPRDGSLLIAKYGLGYYVYTGISFFRQLPEGVPGAYKLFANLVSLRGEAKANAAEVKPQQQKVKQSKKGRG